MKKLMFICLVLSCLSCQKNVYQYIGVSQKTAKNGQVTKKHITTKIEATSDESAYKAGYLKFIVEKGYYKKQIDSLPTLKYTLAKPISFKILDKKGRDLSSTLPESFRLQTQKSITAITFTNN